LTTKPSSTVIRVKDGKAFTATFTAAPET